MYVYTQEIQCNLTKSDPCRNEFLCFLKYYANLFYENEDPTLKKAAFIFYIYQSVLSNIRLCCIRIYNVQAGKEESNQEVSAFKQG